MIKPHLFILLVSIMFLSACGSTPEVAEENLPQPTLEPTVEVFYVTVDVQPDEGGLAFTQKNEVAAGSIIEIKAFPVPGYEFEGWSGADNSTNPLLTLSIDGNIQLTAHFQRLQTPTPEPTITSTPEPTPIYHNPAEISLENEGELLTVCGIVTNFGESSDPQGKLFSFIKLDKEFLISSYGWIFDFGWKGAGLCVEDTVEEFWGKPVFLLDREEGQTGSDCYAISEDIFIDSWKTSVTHYCPAGTYFKPCPDCDESHFRLPVLEYRFTDTSKK